MQVDRRSDSIGDERRENSARPADPTEKHPYVLITGCSTFPDCSGDPNPVVPCRSQEPVAAGDCWEASVVDLHPFARAEPGKGSGPAAGLPSSAPAHADWRRRYAFRLVCTDVLALVWAIAGANVVVDEARTTRIAVTVGSLRIGFGYLELSVFVLVLWLVALAIFGSRRQRVIGTGSAEYRLVAQAALTVLVILVLGVFGLRLTVSRLYVFMVVAAGLLAVALSRMLWRRWLRIRRRAGVYSQRVLLLASVQTAELLAADLRRNPEAGYWVVGACVPDAAATRLPRSRVPVHGQAQDVRAVMRAVGADAVLVGEGHGLNPIEIRDLSWSLVPGRHHMIFSPGLTDIAGPRIHTRPVSGLPLVHVETPRYEGADRILKRSFDVVGAVLLMLALSPVLVPVAVLVATTSPGGIFFRHERIGKDGRPFSMFKFRSMVPNADKLLAALLAEQGGGDTPLFKPRNDPRITPIGRFIRKYSIDEVPQLLNVVLGDMSLVGPRPQVRKEVEMYDSAATRRLLVRPGMTGLWQVSGRSDLDWEASVRLDLFYVDNWSIASDLVILYRTVRAVAAGDGAR
jgi:exopolysaccharide biosynthesis polyprenyl glycosylphosphotransferase